MPTVALVLGYAVMIFFEDHDPPHFHLRGKGTDAKFLLEDLSLVSLKGRLSPAEIRGIRQWARRHLPELYRAWQTIQDGDTPSRIEG